MEATATTLAKLIKTMRTAEGITQAELAEAVYSDVSSIRRWEHGENITWYKFLEIAHTLGYMVDVEVSRVQNYEESREIQKRIDRGYREGR